MDGPNRDRASKAVQREGMVTGRIPGRTKLLEVPENHLAAVNTDNTLHEGQRAGF